MTRIRDPLGSATDYTIDGLGDTEATDSPDTGLTQRSFDAAGNVLAETDARGKITTHQYDALNRLTQTTFDDGTEITYTYDTGTDNRGRLMQLTDPNGSTSWSYDGHGRPTQRRQHLDGIQLTVNYGYDPQGRLIQLTYASGKAVTFGYDPAGRINRVQADGQTIVDELSYHPFGPVTGWQWGNGSPHTRSLDLDGRLSAYPLGGSTQTVSYDLASRITGISGAETQSYGYDALDRLTSVTAPGTTQTYSYDPNGNRQETVYLGDLPIAVLSGTDGIHYVLADQINTPRVITDSQAVVVLRWDSDPFGVGSPDQDPDGNGLGFVYNLRMAGQYFDAETGLHYNYFRDYDPSVGRYVQSDLIGLLGGLNTYAYAANSPARFRDQYGLLDADGHGLSKIANGINGALDGISEALKGLGMGSQAAPELPLWEADGEQSHPDRIDEAVARNCPGDADCGTIGWSIDVLQRQLRFRRWDMQHHGGGDAGHIGFYETLRAELRQLIDLAKSKPCPYNSKADIEVTLPWNYPTPMF